MSLQVFVSLIVKRGAVWIIDLM